MIYYYAPRRHGTSRNSGDLTHRGFGGDADTRVNCGKDLDRLSSVTTAPNLLSARLEPVGPGGGCQPVRDRRRSNCLIYPREVNFKEALHYTFEQRDKARMRRDHPRRNSMQNMQNPSSEGSEGQADLSRDFFPRSRTL